MKLSVVKAKGDFKFPIDLSEKLNEKEGTIVITMGEPNMEDTQALGKKSEEETMEAMPGLLEKYMISHPFKDDENKDCTNNDVVHFLLESADRYSFFVEQWTTNLPLAKRKEAK